MAGPRIAVVVSEPERAQFFPPEVAALLPEGAAFVSADAIPYDSAEVVVGGWSLSDVPDAAVAGLGGGPLRYVCLFTGSPKGKVTAAQIEAGLLVTNWGSVVGPLVAEGGLMMILATLRRTLEHAASTAAGEWKGIHAPGQTLHGKTVAVHGFGGVARALIDLLRPFGCRVRVHAPGVPEHLVRDHGAEPVGSLPELAEGAQVFVEVEALRADNVGSVDAAVLRRLPEGATFVNIGRGPLVDETALAEVAAERGLRVALDVYRTEPLPADSPLRGIEGVLLMPHLAGPPPDSRHLLGRLALENVAAHLRGETPRFVIDADAFTRMT